MKYSAVLLLLLATVNAAQTAEKENKNDVAQRSLVRRRDLGNNGAPNMKQIKKAAAATGGMEAMTVDLESLIEDVEEVEKEIEGEMQTHHYGHGEGEGGEEPGEGDGGNGGAGENEKHGRRHKKKHGGKKKKKDRVKKEKMSYGKANKDDKPDREHKYNGKSGKPAEEQHDPMHDAETMENRFEAAHVAHVGKSSK